MLDWYFIELVLTMLYLFGVVFVLVEGMRHGWSLLRTIRTAVLFPLILLLVLVKVTLNAFLRE